MSDAVDGWLARRIGGPNSVGALLDPVADKALLVTMYVTLAAVNELPDWLAILVVFRDLVIVGGVIVLGLLGLPVMIRPLFVSKLNTALQIVLVALTLLLAGFGARGPAVADGLALLIWAVGATTLASGAAYVWQAARGDERSPPLTARARREPAAWPTAARRRRRPAAARATARAAGSCPCRRRARAASASCSRSGWSCWAGWRCSCSPRCWRRS